MKEMIKIINIIEEKRQEKKIQHKLSDIVMLVLIATIGNADTWDEIELFGKMNKEYLRKYLELKNGIPGHDTIRRVMSVIEPMQLQKVKERWEEIINSNEGEKIKRMIINIDGKTIKGNGNKNQKAIHIVSAWSKESGICFGQKAVKEKSNEITAIPELLELIKVKGNTITIDAMGTQKEIAEKIKSLKGEYVLALKGNQGKLYEEVKTYLEDKEFQKEIKESENYIKTTEKAHGRLEIREYYQTEKINWIEEKESWKGLKSIGMVKTTIKEGGETRIETRYYISSLKNEIEHFAKSIREHWSIESMHWHLDVTFREDGNTTLDKIAAENMNIMRKFALKLIKMIDFGKQYSLKTKRFGIGCNPTEYLAQIFGD